MKKPTKRNAFNFLRSYFDVYNEIPDPLDRLRFVDAIINKQFLNEDPQDMGLIPNLSYESQRHQIEKSVKGWETKTGNELGQPTEDPNYDPNSDPSLPPSLDSTEGPSKSSESRYQDPTEDPYGQEEEKEEEEEEEKEEVKEKVQVKVQVKEQVRRIREVDDYNKKFFEPNDCIQNLLDKKLT